MRASGNFVAMMVLMTLIVSATLVILAPRIIKMRERLKIHETVRYLADKGQSAPTEILNALGAQRPTQPIGQQDLRTGIVWLGVAAGIAGLAVSMIGVSDPGEVSWMIVPGLAAFPTAIGLGYVFLWFINRDRDRTL